EDEIPLELTSEAEAETDESDGEELLLGDDDILTTPVGKPPIAPPTDEDTAAEGAPTAATGGGTLFERMSNIARGAPKAQIVPENIRGGAPEGAPEGRFRPSHRPCGTAWRKASRQKGSSKIQSPRG